MFPLFFLFFFFYLNVLSFYLMILYLISMFALVLQFCSTSILSPCFTFVIVLFSFTPIFSYFVSFLFSFFEVTVFFYLAAWQGLPLIYLFHYFINFFLFFFWGGGNLRS